MLPSLVGKTLRDWRRAIIGWAAGLAAFALLYGSAWASLKNSPDVLRLKTESLPKGLAVTFGVTDLTTGVGYLQGTIYSLVGPLLLTMAAVIFGARAVAGPEDNHVMDLFLANPVSRRGFVVQRTAAIVGVVIGLGLVVWVIALALSQALDMGVSAVDVSAASLGLLLVGLLFGTLALAVGAATGRRSHALAVAGGVAVATYVIRALAESVSWARPWRWVSPYYYYLGADPLHRGFNVGYLLVLLAVAAVLVGVAVVTFDRRDVRV
jgi:beta-exotoxin I transport system permease protein